MIAKRSDIGGPTPSQNFYRLRVSARPRFHSVIRSHLGLLAPQPPPSDFRFERCGLLPVHHGESVLWRIEGQSRRRISGIALGAVETADNCPAGGQIF